MGFLTGKKFLITGISSNRSIAYGIAKACAREGAELALSYNNERFKERVQGFADEFGAGQVIKLDASLTALSTRSAGRPANPSAAASSKALPAKASSPQ